MSTPTPTPTPPSPPSKMPSSSSSDSLLSPRSLKQLGLFFAGAGFMLGSVMVTRRAITRRRIAAMPAFHHATVPARPSSTLASAQQSTQQSSTALTSISTQPSTTTPTESTPQSAKSTEEWRAEGSLMAVEALGLATLNVSAFAIALAGGLAWALDISSVDDMRARARRRLYAQTGGAAAVDDDADREIEEWAASVLARVGVVTGEAKGEQSQE